MTNTHLSDLKLKEAKAKNEMVNGMTAQEVNEYIWWSYDRFQDFLLEIVLSYFYKRLINYIGKNR